MYYLWLIWQAETFGPWNSDNDVVWSEVLDICAKRNNNIYRR